MSISRYEEENYVNNSKQTKLLANINNSLESIAHSLEGILEIVNEDDKESYECCDETNPCSCRDEDDVEIIGGDFEGEGDEDLRRSAKMYTDELNYPSIDHPFSSKKDCILDYVTNEFGVLGARYTDVIKFAYYLGSPNAPKYDNSNRGYYAMALAPKYDGYLIQGGNDYLVKGINKENDERYFAHSFVDQATDYWRFVR